MFGCLGLVLVVGLFLWLWLVVGVLLFGFVLLCGWVCMHICPTDITFVLLVLGFVGWVWWVWLFVELGVVCSGLG